MNSKTIILSPTNENSNARGILTLYIEDDLLKCKIRLYSMSALNAECRIGVYHQKQVYTSNLLFKGGQYESSLVGDFNLNQDFYCAIINTIDNNSVVLAGGTYAGYFFNDNSVFENTFKEEQNTLIDENIEINPQPNCQDCNKCANCKYKEFFYSQQTQIQTEPIKPKPIKEEKESPYPTILDSITPQFKYIFEQYPNDQILNKLVENAKFVKIQENGEQYSIGAIYENEEIKYIAYAIKCNYNTTPPKELGKHYQWLPLDSEDPLSEGYYLVFQDAKDLKILEL